MERKHIAVGLLLLLMVSVVGYNLILDVDGGSQDKDTDVSTVTPIEHKQISDVDRARQDYEDAVNETRNAAKTLTEAQDDLESAEELLHATEDYENELKRAIRLTVLDIKECNLIIESMARVIEDEGDWSEEGQRAWLTLERAQITASTFCENKDKYNTEMKELYADEDTKGSLKYIEKLVELREGYVQVAEERLMIAQENLETCKQTWQNYSAE